MIILVLFAFLAGFITILSPCILPVLPIVLSSSVAGGHRRPLGIVTGFVLSFTFFTLFLSSLVSAFGISAEALRTFSVVIIIGFGVSLLLPQVQAWIEKLFSTISSKIPAAKGGDGFGGGVVVGLSLGLLWTPCVGPILASVISLAITGTVTGSAALITFAYALGTSIPMVAITYGGRTLLNKVPWLLRNTGRIQKLFGVIMIATGLAIFLNWDRQFQTWILTTFPQYGAGLTQFESITPVQDQLKNITGKESTQKNAQGEPMFSFLQAPVAPELDEGTRWLNSEPLLFKENLEGKVVLIDFWTYSCINCIRTFPYLKQWYEKYKDKDFVIIGVHSPEFEFEKNPDNVLKAMTDYGITYPVVQDNEFAIWKAYNNQYWPAHYLVDKTGRIRYSHFGEGKYLETENKIRELLDEEPLSAVDESLPAEQQRRVIQTPETYLGYLRARSYLEEQRPIPDQSKLYSWTNELSTEAIPSGGVVLEGAWKIGAEAVTAEQANAGLHLSFQAGIVHLVMAPAVDSVQPSVVTVLLDGQPLAANERTIDTRADSTILVDRARKYDLVAVGNTTQTHVVTLKMSAGTEAYAFTFGSEVQ